MKKFSLWILLMVNAILSHAANEADEQVITKHLRKAFKHYYTDYDSTKYFLIQASEFAEGRQLWHFHLWANSLIANSANYHGKISELEHHAKLCRSILKKHENEIDDVDEDGSYRAGGLKALAIYYYELGLWDQALEEFLKVTPPNAPPITSNSREVSTNYEFIAKIYYLTGAYDLSILYYQKARTHLDSTITGADYLLAMNHLHVGDSYLKKSENTTDELYPIVAEHYHKAKAFFVSENYSHQHGFISLCKSLAKFHRQSGYIDSAYYYLEEALKIKSKDETASFMTLMELGETSFEAGTYDKATVYFEEALKNISLKFSYPHPDKARALFGLSKGFIEKQLLPETFASLQKAIYQLTGIDSADISKNPVVEDDNISAKLLAQIMQYKASAYKYLYDETSNIEHLEKGIECNKIGSSLIDLMRSRLQTKESKHFLAAELISFYEDAVENTYKWHLKSGKIEALDEMFSFIQKGKNNILKEYKAKKFAGVPDSLLLAANTLDAKIGYLKMKQYNQPADDESNVLFDLIQEKVSLISGIRENHPKYHDFNYENSSLSIDDVQSKLNDNTVFLEYFYGDKAIYAIIITSKSAKTLKVSQVDLIEKYVDTLKKSFSLSFALEKQREFASYKSFCRSSFMLYKLLLSPALQSENLTHVIIIPDGKLGYIPFDLLIKKEPKANSVNDINYRNLNYLINEYTISYRFASLFEKKAEINYKESYIGYAPVFKLEIKGKNSTDVPMSFNNREVTQLAGIFDGSSISGVEATEQSFKDKSKSSRIIHLATHGVADDKNSLYSYLKFSTSSEIPDEPNDGVLYAYELYNLDINAELIILSSCQTGAGRLSRGEGIMSLARAFGYAGSTSILMSLWNANDASTSKIIEGFGKNVKDGYTISEALRQAKLSYLADTHLPHPYYWASLNIIGDDEVIFDKSNNSWVYLVFLLFVSLFVFLVVGRNLKMK